MPITASPQTLVQADTRKKFEPATWHNLYHRPDPTPSQQLFRRVTEEVSLAAQPLIQKKQLWLDLGSGTGELSRQLANSGAEVIGIDLDPAMLRWSGQNVLKDSSVSLLAATTTSIPCSRDSVDGVVAASLTGCLEDLASFWRELSRVLVPGGHAVVSFTNKQSALLALTSQWRRLNKLKDINHPCHGHFLRYRMNEIVHAASNYGLQTISNRYFNCFADFVNWSLPPVRFARKLETVSPQIVQQRVCRSFVMTFQNTKKPSY